MFYSDKNFTRAFEDKYGDFISIYEKDGVEFAISEGGPRLDSFHHKWNPELEKEFIRRGYYETKNN